MLLNFQRQFTEPILAGRKQQTIRSAGHRVHVPKVGDAAHCYTGLRTRKATRLGTWPITRVDVLRMTINNAEQITDLVVGASPVRAFELGNMAQADGFSDWSAMQAWFVRQYGPCEFYGWVIGWDFGRPIPRRES